MADDLIYPQLVKALSDMTNPKKSATNPFFKSKYATLEDSLNIATKTLAKYDLGVMQLNVTREDGSCLVTRIIHKSGQFIEDGGVPLKLKDPNDAQKLGSAITYARRYGLQAMLGMIGEEDDDGNTAVNSTRKKTFADRLKETKELDELQLLWDNNQHKINKLTSAQQSILTATFNQKKEEFDNEDI